MAELEAVLAEALEDLKAGRERSLPDYLQLVPAGDRAELAELLSAFQMRRSSLAGPDPLEPDRLERALELVDRYFSQGDEAGALPMALVELRRSRRLRRGEVVEWLAERFAIPASASALLSRSYHQLEVGRIPGAALSGSLLDALAEYFKVERGDLFAAASSSAAMPLREAQVFGRGLGEAKGPVASAQPPRASRDPAEQLVERLFHGGPDV